MQSLMKRCLGINFCQCSQELVEWLRRSGPVLTRRTRGQLRWCDNSTALAVTHVQRRGPLPKACRGLRWAMGRTLNAEDRGHFNGAPGKHQPRRGKVPPSTFDIKNGTHVIFHSFVKLTDWLFDRKAAGHRKTPTWSVLEVFGCEFDCAESCKIR